MIRFELPYPVSVNSVYRVNKRSGTLYKTKEAKDYESAVRKVLAASGHAGLELDGDLAMTKYLHVPDKRKRDLDNVNKLLWDSITKAKVWIDDDQVVENHEYKIRDGTGKVIIEIEKVNLFT